MSNKEFKPESNILLSEQTLSDMWGVAKVTLRKWRAARSGPPYIRLGVAIRYPADAAQAWLDARRQAA